MTNTRFIGQINEISEVDRLQARHGFKVVMLKTPDKKGNVLLSGPHHYHHSYELSADSTCVKGHNSFEQCSCGFYSYNSASDALTHYWKECGGYMNQALVRVALSQKVVVCEKGYRSSHQRVVKVVMPGCWNCTYKPGTYMVPHTSGYFVTGCESCVASIPSLRDTVFTFDEFSEKFSPEGYTKFEVTSVAVHADPATYKNPTTDAVDLIRRKEAFDSRKMEVLYALEPEYNGEQAAIWLRKMIETKDIPALKRLIATAQTSVDELIAGGLETA